MLFASFETKFDIMKCEVSPWHKIHSFIVLLSFPLLFSRLCELMYAAKMRKWVELRCQNEINRFCVGVHVNCLWLCSCLCLCLRWCLLLRLNLSSLQLVVVVWKCSVYLDKITLSHSFQKSNFYLQMMQEASPSSTMYLMKQMWV